MQAIWIYRTYFQQEFNATSSEIAIICSIDSHYKINTDDSTKELSIDHLNLQLDQATNAGVRYFIVIANMMTTMFGSVDKVDIYTDVFIGRNLPFKLHIDGAYGGFYYPFSNKETNLNFANPHVSSVTLDAHKMAQAPYGTGIFLIRKGLISRSEEHTSELQSHH